MDGLGPVPPVEQRAPGQWQIGTVAHVKPETPRVKSFRIELPMWMPHLPGQHYDVRLTAPDGYHAERSYSIASSPLDSGQIELTIDRLADCRGRVETGRRLCLWLERLRGEGLRAAAGRRLRA